MCGRFALTAKTGEIENLLPDSKLYGVPVKRYNIAPTQKIAAILNTNVHEITYLRWGLIPFWAKDSNIGNSLINARAETLSEKASFKHSLKKRRCLILASGFYEWKTIPGDKKKVPYFIKLKSDSTLTFAGLWDSWRDSSGEDINSCTIITTQPNSMMSEIHNRMPVIISPRDRMLWLSNSFSGEKMLSLLKPFPSEEMEAYPVSNKVNIPGFDDESLIIPLSKETIF